MPFKSKKQETYLKINEPKIYKEWKKRYGTFKSDTLDNKNEQSKYMAETFGAETKRYTDDEMAQAQYPNYFLQKKFGNNTDEELNPILYRHLFIGLSALDTETLDMLEDVVYNETEPNMGEKMKNTLDTVKEYRKLFYNIYGTYPPAYNSKNYYGAETFEYTVPDRINKTNEEKIIEMRKNDGLYNLYGTSDWEDGYESALYADQFGNVFEVRWFFDLSEFYDNKVGYNDDWNGNIEYDFNFSPKFPKGYVYWENMKTKEILAKAPFTHMEKIEQIGKAKPISMNNSLLRRAETFEAPYAGLGSLFGFGQDTGLGSFTTSELTGSSAIHGDFDSASLNYSGHQAVFARAENDAEMKDMTRMQVSIGCPSGSTRDFTKIFDVNVRGSDLPYLTSELEEVVKSRVASWNKDRYKRYAEKEMKNVEFEDWAKQEMKTHGKDVSFKNWAEKEEKSHGNVELMDWAEHEEESHDERYGADMKTYEAYDDKISERQEYLIEKLGGNSNSDMTRSQASDLIKKLQGKKSGTWRAEDYGWVITHKDSGLRTDSFRTKSQAEKYRDELKQNKTLRTGMRIVKSNSNDEPMTLNTLNYLDGKDAEEPMVEEPDFIPDGDGRALGQQTSSINLSPLHSESKLFNKTNALIAGVVGIGLWKGKEILDMTMASLKRSAEEKRKGKACGSCNSQGSIRKTHTQVKNSEYSVDQVNPVEVQGQSDIHGAEGVTNPRHSPSSEPFGYPSKSLKMW